MQYCLQMKTYMEYDYDIEMDEIKVKSNWNC